MIKPQSGFLLVELMLGLVVSILFITIITHYIIEAKSSQHKALKIIEDFSTARNTVEKEIAKKMVHNNA